MTRFTIASFNVKNLIGAEKEYYTFQRYTAEEYAWKVDWLADQILTMNADIVGFQEIFEEDALTAVVDQAPVGMRAVEVAVGRDHLGFDPQAKINTHAVDPVDKRAKTAGEDVRRDIPVAKAGAIRAAACEPAIVEHKALNAQWCNFIG